MQWILYEKYPGALDSRRQSALWFSQHLSHRKRLRQHAHGDDGNYSLALWSPDMPPNYPGRLRYDENSALEVCLLHSGSSDMVVCAWRARSNLLEHSAASPTFQKELIML